MRLLSKNTNGWLMMLVVMGILVVAGSTYAQEELFVEPSSAQLASVDQNRHRINTTHPYIKRHRLAAPIKNLSMAKEQQVILNFFQDAKYKVNVKKVEAEGVSNLWFGHIEGLPLSQVQIFNDSVTIEGRVDTGSQLFVFKGLDGLILISEADKALLPRLDKDQKENPSNH